MSVATREVRLREQDDALVRTLYPSLRRFAAVVAPMEDDPDDLVQEALWRALHGGPISDRDHPLAYLRQTMTNLASNRRRSLGRWRRARRRLEVTDRTDPPYPSDLAVLDELTATDRAVVFLADVEGLSFADVAETLGLSENAARSRASRARRRLAALLSEEPNP